MLWYSVHLDLVLFADSCKEINIDCCVVENENEQEMGFAVHTPHV